MEFFIQKIAGSVLLPFVSAPYTGGTNFFKAKNGDLKKQSLNNNTDIQTVGKFAVWF